MIREILLGIMVLLVVLATIGLASAQISPTPTDSEMISDIDETTKDILEVVESNSIEVSTGATEYYAGENGTIFAKVTSMGVPINDGFCDALIFNSTPAQITGFPLDYINTSRGMYSHTFLVPSQHGLYMVDVECFRPFDGASDYRYFRKYNLTDRLLNTTTPADNQSITLNSIGRELSCIDIRWTENCQDKEDGIISDYRYLKNITDVHGWFSTGSPSTSNIEIFYKYYKVTFFGSLYIGLSSGIASINNVITDINLSDAGIEFPFDSTSLLQIEICYRFVSGATNPDVTFWYNSDYYNSSVTINTIDYNESLDFQVGGSSELHISQGIYERFWLQEPDLISNHDYCYDNITLIKEITKQKCLDSVCWDYLEYENVTCPYGCINITTTSGQCMPAPTETSVLLLEIILLFVALVGLVYWILRKWG